MTKFFVANTLWKVLDQAIQVHGALGYSSDTPLEQMMKNARSARLVDGADEVHLTQICQARPRRVPLGGLEPARDGAGTAVLKRGPLCVVMSRFPAITETFILRELVELDRAGIDVGAGAAPARAPEARAPGGAALGRARPPHAVRERADPGREPAGVPVAAVAVAQDVRRAHGRVGLVGERLLRDARDLPEVGVPRPAAAGARRETHPRPLRDAPRDGGARHVGRADARAGAAAVQRGHARARHLPAPGGPRAEARGRALGALDLAVQHRLAVRAPAAARLRAAAREVQGDPLRGRARALRRGARAPRAPAREGRAAPRRSPRTGPTRASRS